jgi:hypothetical protein
MPTNRKIEATDRAIEAYNAARQAESEAYLCTPEGNAKRLRENAARLGQDISHNYAAWTLDELTELAVSYCHRMELWPLPKSGRAEFDALLAELDFRGNL